MLWVCLFGIKEIGIHPMVADPDFLFWNPKECQLPQHGLGYSQDHIRGQCTPSLQLHKLWIGPWRAARLQAMHMIDHRNSLPLCSHACRQGEPVLGHDQIKGPLQQELRGALLVVAEEIEQIRQPISPGQGLGRKEDLETVFQWDGHLPEYFYITGALMPGQSLISPGEDRELLAEGCKLTGDVIHVDA
ncbi:Uncharacterised protein [uncultured archaeon]|nr:Uncharacterised protein [uncultured archaeon]